MTVRPEIRDIALALARVIARRREADGELADEVYGVVVPRGGELTLGLLTARFPPEQRRHNLRQLVLQTGGIAGLMVTEVWSVTVPAEEGVPLTIADHPDRVEQLLLSVNDAVGGEVWVASILADGKVGEWVERPTLDSGRLVNMLAFDPEFDTPPVAGPVADA